MDKTEKISFYRFRKDGSPNTDIKRAFLIKMPIDPYMIEKGTVALEDETVWKIVVEQSVFKLLKEQPSVNCIVSFQVRDSGNYAVFRVYDPEYKAKGKKS